jgi:AP-1 complex subunit beta-1
MMIIIIRIDEQGRPPTKSGNIFDLDSLESALPPTSPTMGGGAAKPATGGSLLDDLDFLSGPATPAPAAVQKELLLPADRANGLVITAAYQRKDGNPVVDFTLTNQSGTPLSDFAVQFNKNTFGLAPGLFNVPVIMPGQSANVLLPLLPNPALLATGVPPSSAIQVAIKNNTGVYYFQFNLPLYTLFTEGGQVGREEYIQLWKSIADENFKDIVGIVNFDTDYIQRKLQQYNLFYVASRKLQLQVRNESVHYA